MMIADLVDQDDFYRLLHSVGVPVEITKRVLRLSLIELLMS